MRLRNVIPDKVALWMADPAQRRSDARETARRGDFGSFCKIINLLLHLEQQKVVDSSAWVKIVRWGTRCGKTKLAGALAAFVLLQDDTVVWIAAPDHSLCGRVWDEITGILIKGLGFAPSKMSDRPPYRIEFPWGSRCDGKSTEHGARKSLVGEEVDLLIWDEAARSPGSVWPDLSDRLVGADHRGKALVISTPTGLNHFRELCEFAEQDQDWETFHAPSSANPHLDREAIAAQERKLSPETFAQNWLAEFRMFAGQVYSEFKDEPDYTGHTRPLAYDPELPLYLTFDFGVENPFVCLWIQVTGGDVVHVIDEYYKTDWSTIENGAAVLAQHQAAGYREITGAYGDPSGRDAILTLRQQFKLPIVRARRVTPKGFQGREKPATIEIIRRFLRELRLLVDPKCVQTRREFGLYRYPENREDVNAPEEPLKADDHGMDALRGFFSTHYGRTVQLADVDERELSPFELERRKAQRRATERMERAMTPVRWSV